MTNEKITELKEENYNNALDDIFVEIETYLIDHDMRLSAFYDVIDEYHTNHYKIKTRKTNPTIKRIARIAAGMNKKLRLSFVDPL